MDRGNFVIYLNERYLIKIFRIIHKIICMKNFAQLGSLLFGLGNSRVGQASFYDVVRMICTISYGSYDRDHAI